jgi:hypothetical protein
MISLEIIDVEAKLRWFLRSEFAYCFIHTSLLPNTPIPHRYKVSRRNVPNTAPLHVLKTSTLTHDQGSPMQDFSGGDQRTPFYPMIATAGLREYELQFQEPVTLAPPLHPTTFTIIKAYNQ